MLKKSAKALGGELLYKKVQILICSKKCKSLWVQKSANLNAQKKCKSLGGGVELSEPLQFTKEIPLKKNLKDPKKGSHRGAS